MTTRKRNEHAVNLTGTYRWEHVADWLVILVKAGGVPGGLTYAVAKFMGEHSELFPGGVLVAALLAAVVGFSWSVHKGWMRDCLALFNARGRAQVYEREDARRCWKRDSQVQRG